MGWATWSVGNYGEVFGVTAPEAYVPRMMDQEYMPEGDPVSWEEEAFGAEAFQEPPESPTDRAVDNRYRVPLIPQGQAYANHESRVNQVIALGNASGTVMSAPSGEAH